MFGANVRRERCAQGLTQDALAERAEIATRNLQKVEAGRIEYSAHDSSANPIGLEVFLEIADALRVTDGAAPEQP
jgi:transcriptional regulator with XRE-family HTH domain